MLEILLAAATLTCGAAQYPATVMRDTDAKQVVRIQVHGPGWTLTTEGDARDLCTRIPQA
jgi:hypothetical protein